MSNKFLSLTILTLAGMGMTVSAETNLYLIGPGTSVGWNVKHAIGMNPQNTESSGKSVTAYLRNEDGKSFRLQTNKDWDNNYSGPSEAGQTLADGQSAGYVTGVNDYCFQVPFAGVFRVQADTDNHTVTVSRQDSIYVVGDVDKVNWSIENARNAPLVLTDADKGIYSADLTLHTGDFKFTVDFSAGWDPRFFLFRGASDNNTPYLFQTVSKAYLDHDPDNTDNTLKDEDWDFKWTVGTEEGKDLAPGRYRVSVNMLTREVGFIRLPQTAEATGVEFTRDGDNLVGSPQLFLEGNVTVTVDGTALTIPVEETGFYRLTVAPDKEHNNATPILSKGERLFAYLEGYGTLNKVNSADHSELINDDLSNWNEAGKTYNVFVDGQSFGTVSTTARGWQMATATLRDGKACFTLTPQAVRISGNAADYTFQDTDISGHNYVKPLVYIKNDADLSVTIGNKSASVAPVSRPGLYTVRVSNSDDQPVLTLHGPIEVNMPLKESDFAGGKKHYFLTGQRMGAWRLQPEWEFVADASNDGTLTIPSRLLYNGYVMVAMVDNYEDYIAQSYYGYTHTDINAPSILTPTETDSYPKFPLARIDAAGNAEGKYQAVRYDNLDGTAPGHQNGSYDAMENRMITILSAHGCAGKDEMQRAPSRVSSITLDVNEDGTPQTLHFNGVNRSHDEVAKLRTFSLVGGGIYNKDVTYEKDGVTSPLNRQDDYGGYSWSESWIQYDKSQKPYVDAFGEYIYHTSFTRNWLRNHPSYFNFGDDFHYTSNNITFFYDPEASHPDKSHPRQFGQRTWKINSGTPQETERSEDLVTYWAPMPTQPADSPMRAESAEGTSLREENEAATQNFNDIFTVAEGERNRCVCYVIEDMWMEGRFKIWCGWGGASVAEEHSDVRYPWTRWYRDNGGHGAPYTNKPVFFKAGTEMAFTIFRDAYEANFGIGYGDLSAENLGTENGKLEADATIKTEWEARPLRRFFKRVEVWYNLENGFLYKPSAGTASFLIFKQIPGTPTITIQKKNEEQISYSCNSPLVNGLPEDADLRSYGDITYCLIQRVAIDDEGNEGTPVEVYNSDKDPNHADNDPSNDIVNKPRAEFAIVDKLDEAKLPAGRYRYIVTTKRRETGDELFSSRSNIVRLQGGSQVSGVEDVVFSCADDSDTGYVEIYTTGGILVRREFSLGDDYAVAEGLTPGVYIMRKNNRSSRILVK